MLISTWLSRRRWESAHYGTSIPRLERDGLPERGGLTMPTISFTSALQRFLETPSATVEGATLGDALAAVFAPNPALRGYVLDDQGALRRHVAVYVNGRPAGDRVGLSDPLAPGDEIHVFQALTGG
jgi:sulfur-carrier protein